MSFRTDFRPAWMPRSLCGGVTHRRLAYWLDGVTPGSGGADPMCEGKLESAKYPFLRVWSDDAGKYHLVKCIRCRSMIAVQVGPHGPVAIAGEYDESEAPREGGGATSMTAASTRHTQPTETETDMHSRETARDTIR